MSRYRLPILIDFEATICRAGSDSGEIADGVSRGNRCAHGQLVFEVAGRLADRCCLDRRYAAATIRSECTRSSMEMLWSEQQMSARADAKGELLEENRDPRCLASYDALMVRETLESTRGIGSTARGNI